MSRKTTLYRGGHVYSPADPTATAMLVVGDRIAWLGDDVDAPAADATVDLDGALVAIGRASCRERVCLLV